MFHGEIIEKTLQKGIPCYFRINLDEEKSSFGTNNIMFTLPVNFLINSLSQDDFDLQIFASAKTKEPSESQNELCYKTDSFQSPFKFCFGNRNTFKPKNNKESKSLFSVFIKM